MHGLKEWSRTGGNGDDFSTKISIYNHAFVTGSRVQNQQHFEFKMFWVEILFDLRNKTLQKPVQKEFLSAPYFMVSFQVHGKVFLAFSFKRARISESVKQHGFRKSPEALEQRRTLSFSFPGLKSLVLCSSFAIDVQVGMRFQNKTISSALKTCSGK